MNGFKYQLEQIGSTLQWETKYLVEFLGKSQEEIQRNDKQELFKQRKCNF